MDVCGIDPGLHVTGYAVLRIAEGRATPEVLDAGVFRPDADVELPVRLNQLSRDAFEVFEQYQPVCVGVEQLYAHYAHPRTAILMGHARGVILAAAAKLAIEVRSFSATRVKKHLTGNGRASKSQIQRAIMSTLNLDATPEPNDVADALAVAYCCAAEFVSKSDSAKAVMESAR